MWSLKVSRWTRKNCNKIAKQFSEFVHYLQDSGYRIDVVYTVVSILGRGTNLGQRVSLIRRAVLAKATIRDHESEIRDHEFRIHDHESDIRDHESEYRRRDVHDSVINFHSGSFADCVWCHQPIQATFMTVSSTFILGALQTASHVTSQ